jgi:hypothetical protein
MRLYVLTPVALLAACGSPQPAPQPSDAPQTPAAATPAPDTAAQPSTTPSPLPAANPSPAPAATPAQRFVAAQLIQAEWAKAENRDSCAPIAFTDTGGVGGTARRANFSGGWAVAFDLPEQRSAYGVAGPALIEADRGPPYRQTRRLARQWPYHLELAQLERPSFAGYGLEGARRYRPDNPSGAGQNSLAYVRIHRQQCTYNVWSRLGRAHLETLLRGLQLLPRQN